MNIDGAAGERERREQEQDFQLVTPPGVPMTSVFLSPAAAAGKSGLCAAAHRRPGRPLNVKGLSNEGGLHVH
jgi:hypothetical protein